MYFPFPVSCINCNEKQLKCKASSHLKGSCHHCLLNSIECFFPVAAVAASATVSPGVGVYSFLRNCFHCTQSHRQCQPVTIDSHNAHDAPSAGFPFYINYRHKDDVMILWLGRVWTRRPTSAPRLPRGGARGGEQGGALSPRRAR